MRESFVENGFLNEDEDDIFDINKDRFIFSVPFNEDAENLMKFLGLIVEYDFEIDEIYLDGYEPRNRYSIRSWIRELMYAYKNGREDVIDTIKCMIEEQFSHVNVEYAEER